MTNQKPAPEAGAHLTREEVLALYGVGGGSLPPVRTWTNQRVHGPGSKGDTAADRADAAGEVFSR